VISSMKEESKQGNPPDSSLFIKNLKEDIEHVNKFLTMQEEMIVKRSGRKEDPVTIIQSLKKLHKFAVLNYLAILKILKKHDKHFETVRPHILEHLVKTVLYEAVKTPRIFDHCQKVIPGSSRPECPICLEKCIVPVSLVCGHEFCSACMWKGDSENLNRCPLCRKSQTLNPSEMGIVDILGKLSEKYFPRRVGPIHQENTSLLSAQLSCAPCEEISFEKVQIEDHKMQEKKSSIDVEVQIEDNEMNDQIEDNEMDKMNKQEQSFDIPCFEKLKISSSVCGLRNGLYEDLSISSPKEVNQDTTMYRSPSGLPTKTHDDCVFQLDL